MDSIKVSVLRKMPPGRFMRFEDVKDMSGVSRCAIRWMFLDGREYRHAYFCVESGEYLGEAVSHLVW